MKRIVLMAGLLLAGVLSGCAGNHTNYNRASMDLSLGMGKPEVLTLLGEPRRTDVNESRERWIYWNPVLVGFTPIDNENLAQDRLVVTFEDGEVTKWGQQTITDDMMEASQSVIESSYRMSQQAQPPRQ